MADIIQLLPDSIANQIAAGEVIQRPASVVKELLENAVDAGADEINLIVKDAGKTLIRVIDNGSGMSETDVRMSLERHATSKIRQATDLFSIRTLGFRGEALASIASIAQLEIKTKEASSELGSRLLAEGSKVISQEPCTAKQGTSVSVKNLFFNIPARRKFLKSPNVETRHIIDEFERVALINPDVKFTFHHNENEVFHLEKGNFRQRITGLFGKKYQEKLVPIEQETNLVNLSGFIIKPEGARKTRGDQFLFVNQRFFKSHYFHNAISRALEELIPKGYHPGYFIMMDIDPSALDVNIHPTKTEVKFEDEKAIYAIVNSSVKMSIGKYNISPTLDFEQESSFDVPPLDPTATVQMPTVKVNPDYNPFEVEKQRPTTSSSKSNSSSTSSFNQSPQTKHNRENWEKLYNTNDAWKEFAPIELPEDIESIDSDEVTFTPETSTENAQLVSALNTEQDLGDQQKLTFQMHAKYIVSNIKSGMMVIHQSRAHERVMFEQYLEALEKNNGGSQQLLFPQTLEFNTIDAGIIADMKPELKSIGFELNEFGKNSFIIQGLPAYASDADPKDLLEGVIEQFKSDFTELKLTKQEALARSLAYKTAIRTGKKLSTEEMIHLIDQLFACSNPYTTPSGKNIIVTLTLDELNNRFD